MSPSRRRRGGWRSHKGRIEAYVRLGTKLQTHQFPSGTAPKDLQAWIDHTFYDYLRKHPRGEPGTLAADVATYLPLLADRPSLQRDRRHELGWWCERFGRRPRWSLEAYELEAALKGLLAEGYAVSTVKKHRTALFHLFTKLDGKNASNPLRDVPLPKEPDPQPRAIPAPLLEQIFAHMPDQGQGARFGKRSRHSKTKARLQVMAAVGLPPAQLAQIKISDLDFLDRSVLVQARKKGAGSRTVRLPLSEQGVLAFRAFVEAEAFGRFSNASAGRVWHGAINRLCTALESKDETHAEGVRLRKELAAFKPRPYDLRHTAITNIYLVSHDIRATQLFAMHADPRMTARYTLAAVDPRLRDVVNLIDQDRRETNEPSPPPAETRRNRRVLKLRTTTTKPAKIPAKRRKIS